MSENQPYSFLVGEEKEPYTVNAPDEESAIQALTQLLGGGQAPEQAEPEQARVSQRPLGPRQSSPGWRASFGGDEYTTEEERARNVIPTLLYPFSNRGEDATGTAENLTRGASAGLARVPLGAFQAGTWIGDQVGRIYDKEPATPFATELSDKLLESIRGGKYSDAPPSVWLPERTTEMLFGGSMGFAAKGTRFRDAVAAGAKNGLAGSLAFYEDGTEQASKARSAVLGTAVSTSLATIVAGVPVVGKGLFRAGVNKRNALGDEAQAEAMRTLEEFAPEISDWVTSAQRSGSASAAQAEANAAGRFAIVAMREQANALRASLKRYGERWGDLWDPERAASQIGKRGRTAFEARKRDMVNARREMWDSGIAQAEEFVKLRKINAAGVEGAEQIALSAPSLKQNMKAAMDEFDPSLWNTDATLPLSNLNPHVADVFKQLDAFKGNLPLETVITTLKRLNGKDFRISPVLNDAQNKSLAKALRETLLDSIDTVDPASSGAIQALRAVRQDYRMASAAINDFNNSAAAKALGITKNGARVADPQATLAKIGGASPSAQTEFRQLLEQYDPDLLQQTRALVWDKALKKAQRTAGSGAESTFDQGKFVSQMIEDGQLKASGLYSPSEIAELEKALPAMRAIEFHYGQLARGPEGVGIAMSGAQSVASKGLNAAFNVRQIYRGVVNPRLDRLYFTAAGRREIQNVAAWLGNSEKLAQAEGRLMAFLSSSMPATNVEE